MRKQALVMVSAALAAGFCPLSPLAVQAQAYKVDDIVKHVGAATANLGVSRGLCVGTGAECSKVGHAVKPAAGAFDLVVEFKDNSDVLELEARLNPDEFAKALKDPQLSASSFLVEGRTGATGTADYNLGLSERPAKAVVRYLSERGVDTAKFVPWGHGQTKPLVADKVSADNCRVETRLQVG